MRVLFANLSFAVFFFLSFFLLLRQANIADYGDNQWVTCFQESAEAILGQNAAYLGQLKESVRLVFLNRMLAGSPSVGTTAQCGISRNPPSLDLSAMTCWITVESLNKCF